MTCAHCGTRKAKRQCPGLNGEICAICCGTQREQSIDCPLDCEYLKEGHKHEKLQRLDPETIPNRDIRTEDEFIQQHEWVFILLGSAVADGAMATPGCTDYDIREALARLVDQWRTPKVESTTENPAALAILASVEKRVEDIRARIAEAAQAEAADETATLADETVLGMLAFLQRLEYAHNNGRRLSRSFLGFLLQFRVPPETLEPEATAVIE